MRGQYFVMLITTGGGIVPLVDDDGAVLQFDTEAEADRVAGNNPLGAGVGYELYFRGEDCAERH